MKFLKSAYHYILAFLGAVIYRFPSREIFVLGVTGTKGKSTTLEIISSILEEGGYRTAICSSHRFKIGEKSEENMLGNTMPGRFFIQKFLRRAVRAKCKYALIEVTSQGVLQSRHRFIDFKAAMFLNLHREHIEAHGGFEQYREAKLDFFRSVSKSSKKRKFFINIDSEHANYFKDVVGDEHEVIFYSGDMVKNSNLELKEPILTDFYLENIAAVVAFAKSQKISEEIIKNALLKFPGVPGRMEILSREPFWTIIDYAHTPDSLEKVYKFLKSSMFDVRRSVLEEPRSSITEPRTSKLICVLGSAGGGRDTWKRPAMGEIAAKYCNEIIITNEDPYDENPREIIEQISLGFSQAPSTKHQIPKVYKIIDRREAIQKAISLAKKGDVVIITGKGSEHWIHTAHGKKIPWNERRAVVEALKTKELKD